MTLTDWPLWATMTTFAISASVVWTAGSRAARLVDTIASRTRLGHAFAGMLLLGGITSLAEISSTTTAASNGNASLALNGLLGSASINVVLLAVADAVLGRDALTSVAAKPVTLLQGVLGMLVLAAVTIAVLTGDFGILGVGVGTVLLAMLCAAALWIAARYEHKRVWSVVDPPDDSGPEGSTDIRPLASLIRQLALVALLIAGAGSLLALSGDALAQQTGLGSGLVGFLLVGFATSLPELSSIVGALRLRRYEMVLGDIFGTNLFNIALIFVADVAYREGPVLNEAGRFEAIGALVALVLTGIYVVGLLERGDRTILRMGYDSLAAILAFCAGVAVMALTAA